MKEEVGRVRSSALAVVLSLGVVLAAACSSSDDGAQPAGGGGSAGDAGSLIFEQSPCGQCTETSCAIEITGCSAEPDCTKYLACLRTCPVGQSGSVDESCEDSCEAPTSTAGKTALGALTACRKEGAGLGCPECGLTSILNQTCGTSTLTDPCPKCEEERCCLTRAACKADAECEALVTCVQTCAVGDGACEEQCYIDHESGVAALGPRLTCLIAKCPDASECGPADPAAVCIAEKCANTNSACLGDLECFLLQHCVGGCAGDTSCVDSCISTHSSAEKVFLEFTSCALALCGTRV